MTRVNGSHNMNGHISLGDGGIISKSEPQERHSSRRRKYAALAGVALFIAAFGRWLVIETDRSPVLTYVSMSKPVERAVYFQPETAKAGDTVQLVFNRTKWLDTKYKSAKLIFHATCMKEVYLNGLRSVEPVRSDFPAYQINVPINTGEVPTKSRPFEVPADCLPGPLAYRGFARHERGVFFSDKETRDMPEVFLTVTGK